jgi:hypothetical protein
MARSRTLLTSVAALLFVLASCSEAPPAATLPDLVDTTTGVAGIIVGASAGGPVLWGSFPDIDAYNNAYFEFSTYAFGGERPDWAPAGTIEMGWALACYYGVEEAWSVADEIGDAWDGSDIYLGPGWVDFELGTLREYADGTLILSCPALDAPTGVAVTRHFAVPGAGPGGRFAVEIVDLVGTASAGFDLAAFEYILDDGADDNSSQPWQTHGSVGPFEWATKDDNDNSDPAVGVIPLLSTHLVVDMSATGGDEYVIVAADGATLAAGERAVLAMVTGIRGGFSAGDAAGKNAAMLALGQELAALDGDAVCTVGVSGFHVWAKLIDPDGALLEAICDGYDAL